jgi:hypothetical protein
MINAAAAHVVGLAGLALFAAAGLASLWSP